MLRRIRKALLPDPKTEYFRSLDMPSSDFKRKSEIRNALMGKGFWEEHFEWRISTVTHSKIQAVHEHDRDWFKVTICCGHEFSCLTPTIDRAIEFLLIYERLTMDMFYNLGWPSWASKESLYPEEGAA